MNNFSYEVAKIALAKAARIVQDINLNPDITFSTHPIQEPSKSSLVQDDFDSDVTINFKPNEQVGPASFVLRLENRYLNKLLGSLKDISFLKLADEKGDMDEAIQREVENVVKSMVAAIKEYDKQCLLIKAKAPENLSHLDRMQYNSWQTKAADLFSEKGAIRDNMLELVELVVTFADTAGVNADILKQGLSKINARRSEWRNFE